MRSTHGTRTGPAGTARPTHATTPAGPAVARMVLGSRLRELREAQYVSRQEAAEAIRSTDTRLAGIELGRTGCRLRDVADLLTIFSVDDDAERAVLLGLAEQANRPGWWDDYRDVVPEWLETYLGLEQAASVIRAYEPQFVPGLLQTPEYARALFALGHPGTSTSERERRVRLRTRRQDVLHRTHPPHLWAVIDEAALRRPFGGPDTLRAQLHHLTAVSRLPHVTVQVLPLHTGGLVTGGGAVSLLRLAESGLPDVAYLEQLRSARYPEDREEVEFYRHLIDRIVTLAEPAARTPALLHELIHDCCPDPGGAA
ncbi:helix-turn-helix transcriptional regulator [Streptomyces sp. DSM 42041]|uniref:Helix-turn-helix transcriptional regulator n=1 Tax=Streptomyces hazeniae TaxID=3075538 RepID=A0ABU2NWY6_9ACTN|nr:helix-turn-helix transcriptional regulator [Streptomyces sp. DSM 42041]MDT0381507.1 helix-turn-helix transcriptional regulator [Streptomyces sp. DSM 42041]